MKSCLKTLVLLLTFTNSWIASSQEQDPIYVFRGILYRFKKSQMTRSYQASTEEETLSLKLPFMGDASNTLIFRIDADVIGYGSYVDGFQCNVLFRQPDGTFRIGAGTPPNCTSMSFSPGNTFDFRLDLSVQCSGIPIGSDSIDLSRTLQAAEYESIRKTAAGYASQRLYPYPALFDTRRSLTLSVDNDIVGSGSCTQLDIVLKGRKTLLSEVNLELIVGESF